MKCSTWTIRACLMMSTMGTGPQGILGSHLAPLIVLENWTLGQMAHFSVEANGFLSEVRRVSSEH